MSGVAMWEARLYLVRDLAWTQVLELIDIMVSCCDHSVMRLTHIRPVKITTISYLLDHLSCLLKHGRLSSKLPLSQSLLDIISFLAFHIIMLFLPDFQELLLGDWLSMFLHFDWHCYLSLHDRVLMCFDVGLAEVRDALTDDLACQLITGCDDLPIHSSVVQLRDVLRRL